MKANYLTALTSMLLLFVTGFINSDWKFLKWIQLTLLIYPCYTFTVLSISFINSVRRRWKSKSK